MHTLRHGVCGLWGGDQRADRLAGQGGTDRASPPVVSGRLGVCRAGGGHRAGAGQADRQGRFTSQFLARLLVDKYVSGRPLSRIAASLSHEGFEVAPGTLVGALKTCSGLLAPLDAQIRDRNAAAGHLHVDETSWKVFETVAGKANQRWWLWVFVAADTTLFTIEPSRSTRVLADHLDIDLVAGELTAGRRLLVSSDFFTVYQALDRVQGVD